MKTFMLCLIAFVLSCSTVMAQEAEQQGEAKPSGAIESRMIVASSDDGQAPQIQFYSTTWDGVQMGEALILAEPAGRGPTDPFTLVNNKSVQKEVELVDEQLKQLQEIGEEYSRKISLQMGDIRKGDLAWGAGRGKDLKRIMEELNQQRKAKMEEILLPHQLDRLKQIALQQQMRFQGDAETLASQQLAEALNITAEQKQKIKERAQQIKEHLEAKIARLKEEAKQELLGELSASQRKKLKELTGDAFEVKPTRWQERIQRARRSNSEAKPPEDGR